MARPKEFNKDEAIDAAIEVFRRGGYEAASAATLTAAMGIGRQSLYDTFGDKWGLYLAALERYVFREVEAHRTALRGGPRAMDGIVALVQRVVREARAPCLGLSAICEFGTAHADVVKIRVRAGSALREALEARVRDAQADGAVAGGLDAGQVASFLAAQVAAIRMAGRAGAPRAELEALGTLALRALA